MTHDDAVQIIKLLADISKTLQIIGATFIFYSFARAIR